MAKLADASALGADGATLGGSNPLPPTEFLIEWAPRTRRERRRPRIVVGNKEVKKGVCFVEQLTDAEIKIIKKTYKCNRTILPYALIALGAEIYIWIKYFAYLTPNWRVAMYNAVIYGSLAFAIIYNYFYYKKIEKIFKKVTNV